MGRVDEEKSRQGGLLENARVAKRMSSHTEDVSGRIFHDSREYSLALSQKAAKTRPSDRRNSRGGIQLPALFLGFSDLGTRSCHFAFGHVSSQPANVVLKEFVFVFKLVVIRFHGFDAFG